MVIQEFERRSFSNWEYFQLSRTVKIPTQGWIQEWSNRVVYQKTIDWDPAARNQVKGFAKLIVGIEFKKNWKNNHQQLSSIAELTKLQY